MHHKNLICFIAQSASLSSFKLKKRRRISSQSIIKTRFMCSLPKHTYKKHKKNISFSICWINFSACLQFLTTASVNPSLLWATDEAVVRKTRSTINSSLYSIFQFGFFSPTAKEKNPKTIPTWSNTASQQVLDLSKHLWRLHLHPSSAHYSFCATADAGVLVWGFSFYTIKCLFRNCLKAT